MSLVLVQTRNILYLVYLAVNANPNETLLPHQCDDILVPALPAAHQRRQQGKPGTRRQLAKTVNNLFRLPLNMLVAAGTVLSDYLPLYLIFLVCSVAHGPATFCQTYLAVSAVSVPAASQSLANGEAAATAPKGAAKVTRTTATVGTALDRKADAKPTKRAAKSPARKKNA